MIGRQPAGSTASPNHRPPIQPIDPAPPALARRTSWGGCCGVDKTLVGCGLVDWCAPRAVIQHPGSLRLARSRSCSLSLSVGLFHGAAFLGLASPRRPFAGLVEPLCGDGAHYQVDRTDVIVIRSIPTLNTSQFPPDRPQHVWHTSARGSRLERPTHILHHGGLLAA